MTVFFPLEICMRRLTIVTIALALCAGTRSSLAQPTESTTPNPAVKADKAPCADKDKETKVDAGNMPAADTTKTVFDGTISPCVDHVVVTLYDDQETTSVAPSLTPPVSNPVVLEAAPKKQWEFGLNAELQTLRHPDFNRTIYSFGVHLGFNPGRNKVQVTSGIGGCAVSRSWDDLALSANLRYVRHLSDTVGMGIGFRGFTCYDLRADEEVNQTIYSFGPELVGQVSRKLTFGVGFDSFSRFRVGEKRQMDWAVLAFMQGDVALLKF
jgi:hypothetical protein